MALLLPAVLASSAAAALAAVLWRRASAPPRSRLALVTGANRGIGYAIARALARLPGVHVVVTARSAPALETLVDSLRADGAVDVIGCLLDVTDARSIAAAAELTASLGGLDWLVNNAGVVTDPDATALAPDCTAALASFDTNTMGPMRTAAAFMPQMLAKGYGRVVNVSSRSGQLTRSMGYDCPGYSLSKAALNMATRLAAAHVAEAAPGADIIVSACTPGYVRTDMTANVPPGVAPPTRTPDEGAVQAIQLCLAEAGTASGCFWGDGAIIPL